MCRILWRILLGCARSAIGDQRSPILEGKIIMIRKTYVLPVMLLIGFSLCFISSFANEIDEKGEFVEDDFILKGIFEFPTAEGPAYIQGSPEFFQRSPQYIFGSPDFEKMRDLPPNSQDYQLGRKVGAILIPQRNNPSGFWICTGFLVGPDLFMTNHHCIYDDNGRLPLSDARIYMDYYQEPDVDPTLGGVTARVSGVLQEDAVKDYALLRLDTPIGNTYGWLELDTTTPVNTGQSVKIIHHSNARSKEISRRNSQIVDVPADFRADFPELRYMVAYLADTEGGSSGAPVFLRDGTGVIAINHSGWFRRIGGRIVPEFNAGTLMSYIVPEIQQWLPGGSPTPPPPSTGNLMYWADYGTNKIQRATLNGTNVQDLVTGLRTPEGIALDVTGGKMYWTDNGTDKIQRSNLDGSNIEDLVTGLSSPESIALDVAGGKMYWTDASTNKIQRATLNGSNIEDLITTGLFEPEGIALDVAGGKMYWTEYSSNKIRRANLDGSHIEDLVTGLRRPDPIALDIAGGKMYWGEYLSEKIRRANLDGSHIEDLVTTGLYDPEGIALDIAGGKMYWTDTYYDRIQRANLDGSNIENLITRGLSNPDGIALGISPSTTPISFTPPTIADQTFTVNTPITPLQLPVATGGTPPYTYTLSPIPNGLDFNAATRLLIGTPTTEGFTHATYTATDATGATAALNFTIEVIAGVPTDKPLDVNADGQVDVLDLVLVAVFYGTRGNGLPADVNADGIVNVQDFAAVAAGVDAANALPLEVIEQALLAAAAQAAELEAAAGAPVRFGDPPRAVLSVKTAYGNVADALVETRHIARTNTRLGEAVALLETLLSLLAEMGAIPETTALLPNYPNPFNPETWIPYELAESADVTVHIYSVKGDLIRTLVLGHQPVGIYRDKSRAAYWDGKNAQGERVASGVYFYTLTAGDFTATRKLLIRK